jgi:rare lipoprotein A (peptidoglycan hydrolase)
MVLKPGCRVQFTLMQFKKTISFLFTGAIFFLPVSAKAISQSSDISDRNSISTLDTTKWRLRETPETLQNLASVYYGTASWYGPGFYGNLTANGEVYRQWTYTVAHRHLPMGTRVRVTNLSNGRSVIARVNDRGPYVGGRIVDLAHGTASALGVISTGIAEVKLEVLR